MDTFTEKRLQDVPLGTKATAIGGGHWVKVDLGWDETAWKWHVGSTFPRPGADWDGCLILPAEHQSQ